MVSVRSYVLLVGVGRERKRGGGGGEITREGLWEGEGREEKGERE